ncbi:hypothetical protein Bca52824_002149 [Brassica carinata]|uniref:NAC domain-containing protein n=1 Tax=Brassica carinata TaxID=52824 RepID=A0A8X8BAB3_BRACI|nr:hypothetical protein Bca52824_002149 [Brassica carinata]
MATALSMFKSKELVWYFISPKEYTSPKNKLMKRTTPSGYWKSMGKDRKVKEYKKTLVYHEGNSSNLVWTPWTMHEYLMG